MTQAVAEREPEVAADSKDELAVFRKQDAIVADLRDKYMGLTIKGIDDKKGFDAVHAGRMVVKNARVDVEKTRVKLKADVLERGRKIDAEAKRVTALLAPIEEHLESEEAAVTTERERIKNEAEAVRKAIIKQRFDALQVAGYTGDMMAVPDIDDATFAAVLKGAQAEKAEHERLAAEERERQAAETERLRKVEAEAAAERAKAEREAAEARRREEEALAKQRAEQERVAAEQANEAARLRAEQQRIADEQSEHKRQVELEKAKQEAAERAKKETEERLAREAAETKAAAERKAAQERADAEAAEAARLKAEAERPHREKILAIADAIDALTAPEGPKHDAVALALSECANRIRGIANGKLTKP